MRGVQVGTRMISVSETEGTFAGIFDEDYLHFYSGLLTDDRSDADTDLIWRLLELEPGMAVLDLACGHGRIANRLAARGCRVTGLDATPLFLDVARADAAGRGVEVDYIRGDMRDLPWAATFDRVVNWFTAYGYFDDVGNRTVLGEVAKVLKPAGRLMVEINNYDWVVRNFLAQHHVRVGDDFMIDQVSFDPLTGRTATRRSVVRAGAVRHALFTIRMFTFPELRDWLLAAGFAAVDGFGEDGSPLAVDHRRMIVTARAPD